MPLVQVDTLFQEHMLALASMCRAAYAGSTFAGQRVWMLPALNGWTGNPLDIVSINDAFDREELNALYGIAIGDPAQGGTVADCAAAKLQIDYTAVMERAFRTRHMTYSRAVAHASGRRRAQGADTGIFTGSVLPYVQGIIEAGSDTGE